jgi:hypothetical protein
MVGEAHAPPPPARRLDRDNAPPPPPTLLVPPPYDPALDAAIKQLLDQQAEIQAKLAQLLPQKYGPNIKVELDMLRHKLLVLEAYATDNRELLSLSLSLSLFHTPHLLRSTSMLFSAHLVF